jgi:hypothetical protein
MPRLEKFVETSSTFFREWALARRRGWRKWGRKGEKDIPCMPLSGVKKQQGENVKVAVGAR